MSPITPHSTANSQPSIPSCLKIQDPLLQYPISFQQSIDDALKNAWVPATLKTYATGINAYVTFCRLHHIPSSLVYPSSEFLLCAFFASKQSLSPATLKNYTADLRAWHIRGNHVFPTSERLKLIVKSLIPRIPLSLSRNQLPSKCLNAWQETFLSLLLTLLF